MSLQVMVAPVVPRAGQHGEELPRDGNIFGVALLTIEAGIFVGQRHHN